MTTGQLSEADVKRLYAEKKYAEIEQARAAGRLNVLMGGEAPMSADHIVTQADVSKLYAEKRYSEIEALRTAGRLTHLLNPTAPQES